MKQTCPINKTLHTYICIFIDEAQNHIYADEGPWATDACTTVCDDGSWSMNVSHVRNKSEQMLGLRGRSVVRPSGVVQMSYKLCFISLKKRKTWMLKISFNLPET